MRDLDHAALDRYITGNYGEDFFRDADDCDEVEDDPAEAWWDANEDRVMEERAIRGER